MGKHSVKAQRIKELPELVRFLVSLCSIIWIFLYSWVDFRIKVCVASVNNDFPKRYILVIIKTQLRWCL